MEYIISFKNYVSTMIHKPDKEIDILNNSNNNLSNLNDSFVIVEDPIPKPPPYPKFHRIYFSKDAWEKKVEEENKENKENKNKNKEKNENSSLEDLTNKSINSKKNQTNEYISYKNYKPHIHSLSTNLNDYFGFKKYNIKLENSKNISNFNVLGNFKYNFTNLGNLPPFDIYKNNLLYKPIKGKVRNFNLHQPQNRMTINKYFVKKSGPK